jgi:hypothetical protein
LPTRIEYLEVPTLSRLKIETETFDGSQQGKNLVETNILPSRIKYLEEGLNTAKRLKSGETQD